MTDATTDTAGTDWKSHILDVPDFPKPGVVFKDITPMLAHGPSLKAVIDTLANHYGPLGVNQVVGIESRGFILGAALAYAMDVGLTLVRKPGKLPRPVNSVSYDLEYGSDTVELHQDDVGPDDKVVIIDDVLATGGTAAAVCELVRESGAELIGAGFLIEIDALGGRKKLPAELDVFTMLHI